MEFNKKRHESLRCLFASVASIVVLDWLLEKQDIRDKIANEAIAVSEELINIRIFFLTPIGNREDVIRNVVQLGSPLLNHIYAVLFADAIRWWTQIQYCEYVQVAQIGKEIYVESAPR